MTPLRAAVLTLCALLPAQSVAAQAPVAAFEGRPFFSEGAGLIPFPWRKAPEPGRWAGQRAT